jgi:cysteine-rich repeat protein
VADVLGVMLKRRQLPGPLDRFPLLLLLLAAACGDNIPPTTDDRPPVPVTPSFALTILEDGTVEIDARAVDPDGTNVTYTISTPAHGTLTGTGPLYRYTGALDYSGTDAFVVTASAGALSVEIPVTLTITSVNDAPVAPAQTVTTGEDLPASITLAATDVDSAALTYSLAMPPAHGVLSGTPPALTYTPALNYAGADSFTFTASDGSATSIAATVAITVTNVIECGDGVVEGNESCDDANTNDSDACRNSCVSATCGDGVVQADVEQCDDGNDDDSDACRNTCVIAACGDGVVQAGVEQCDDGNDVDGDACRNSCVAAVCGDGVVQAGVEQCDDANDDDSDACRNSCVAAACGDGVVHAGVEQCDDANADNRDACLSSCVVASCGDGFTQTGVESCDDGNNSDTDACLSTCVSAACGDGFTQEGVEQCDDANQSNTDACLNSCVSSVCGDGFVESGVEACDDGNQVDNDACHNDCTAPVCGDGAVDPGEECDDSNTSDNDGCGHTCLVERCGDGFVQLPAGETCDDGNTSNGDGCDAVCHVEPFVTTSPVIISGGQSCTTSVANAARKIAVDGSGNIYAVMQCDIRALAASSINRGNSFSTPFDLSTSLGTVDSPAIVAQVAVGNGPSRVAYAAIMLNTGAVYLRVTEDAGATWSPGVLVGTAVSTGSGLSLQSFNDDVYVGFAASGGVAVAINHSRGAGTFDITPVGMSIAYFDLLYDIALGTLAVVADTPGFHIRVSNDGGVNFNSEVNPPGQEYYSDWTIGNGVIFVSGTNLGASGDSNSVYRIASSNPTASTRIIGLPAMSTAQARTVAADAAGNLFAGSQLNGGGIQLDRLGAGTNVFNTGRLISMAGTSPIVSGLPGNSGAAVVYTNAGNVYATIQVYP